MSRAVEDGVLKLTSVSQVKNYRTCRRMWWFDKVAHVPRPSKGYQEVGDGTHFGLARWITHGEQPDPNACEHLARAAILKHRKTEGTEEDVRKLVAALAVPLRGLYSLLPKLPPRERLISESEFRTEVAGVPFVAYLDAHETETPHVLDLKTTKNPRKWAMDEEELRRDVQSGAYAWLWNLRHSPGAIVPVRASWLYVASTGGTYGKPTSVLLSPLDISSARNYLGRAVEEMKVTAGAKSADEVEPNFNACGAFGGCPYRSTCHPDPLKRLEINMKLSDLMGGAAPAAPAPAPVAATPAPAGFVPPDAPEHPVDIAKREGLPIPAADGKFEDGPAPVPDAEVVQREELGRGEPEKPKRARKAKAPEAPAVNSGDVIGAMKEAHPRPPAADKVPGAFGLYVDAMPDGKETTPLEVYLARWSAKVAAVLGLSDMRLAPYNGWKGPLSLAIRQDLPSGIVIARRGTDVAEVAIETLVPLAGLVVRGMR